MEHCLNHRFGSSLMFRALRVCLYHSVLRVSSNGATAKTKRLGDGKRVTYVNPDMAAGRTFHVNAKQWSKTGSDGRKRCYFIVVGESVAQGPPDKNSNEECNASYAHEYNLGRYSHTTAGGTPIQHYSGGDSKWCGLEDLKQRKRKTTLTMVKRDQDGITASVKEVRQCEYKVTLYGSVFLLTGGDGLDSLLAGTDRDALPGGASGPAVAPSADNRRLGGKRKQSSRKSPNHWVRVKQEATEVVRSTSRTVLLTKPVKILQQLLRDLGASCKSCLEKSQLVDKLQNAARVHSEL